jgi:hypothetical protein
MTGLGLTPLKTILVLAVLYIVPLVVAQGCDVIWFGILVIAFPNIALFLLNALP